jgi:hypothetical protein
MPSSTVWGLGRLGGIHAGQSYRDPLPSLPHPDGVAVTDREHRGAIILRVDHGRQGRAQQQSRSLSSRHAQESARQK